MQPRTGEQSTAFFRSSFVKRLPREIQVHLSQCETTDLKELAQRVDQLWLSHRTLATLATVAAEETGQEDLLCTAVPAKVASKAGTSKKKQKKLITFCYLHYKFGKAAWRCNDSANCQFEEN
jgi:hypothetical protein